MLIKELSALAESEDFSDGIWADSLSKLIKQLQAVEKAHPHASAYIMDDGKIDVRGVSASVQEVNLGGRTAIAVVFERN